jgi:hypothetical protein
MAQVLPLENSQQELDSLAIAGSTVRLGKCTLAEFCIDTPRHGPPHIALF